MSDKVDAIERIGSKYRPETLKNDDEKKVKINSCFNTNVAFVPQGGIGSLLNGSNQSAQTAVQA